MAVISYLTIGATLALALWTMFATIRPNAARIADLLVNGPVMTPRFAVPVPARSNLRDIRVRAIRPSLPLRAAA